MAAWPSMCTRLLSAADIQRSMVLQIMRLWSLHSMNLCPLCRNLLRSWSVDRTTCSLFSLCSGWCMHACMHRFLMHAYTSAQGLWNRSSPQHLVTLDSTHMHSRSRYDEPERWSMCRRHTSLRSPTCNVLLFLHGYQMDEEKECAQ